MRIQYLWSIILVVHLANSLCRLLLVLVFVVLVVCHFSLLMKILCVDFIPSRLSSHGVTVPSVPGPLRYRGIWTTLGRTPLDERSARSRDLYLTRHKACKREPSMPPACERTHTDALAHAAAAVGTLGFIINQYCRKSKFPNNS